MNWLMHNEKTSSLGKPILTPSIYPQGFQGPCLGPVIDDNLPGWEITLINLKLCLPSFPPGNRSDGPRYAADSLTGMCGCTVCLRRYFRSATRKDSWGQMQAIHRGVDPPICLLDRMSLSGSYLSD